MRGNTVFVGGVCYTATGIYLNPDISGSPESTEEDVTESKEKSMEVTESEGKSTEVTESEGESKEVTEIKERSIEEVYPRAPESLSKSPSKMKFRMSGKAYTSIAKASSFTTKKPCGKWKMKFTEQTQEHIKQKKLKMDESEEVGHDSGKDLDWSISKAQGEESEDESEDDSEDKSDDESEDKSKLPVTKKIKKQLEKTQEVKSKGAAALKGKSKKGKASQVRSKDGQETPEASMTTEAASTPKEPRAPKNPGRGFRQKIECPQC